MRDRTVKRLYRAELGNLEERSWKRNCWCRYASATCRLFPYASQPCSFTGDRCISFMAASVRKKESLTARSDFNLCQAVQPRCRQRDPPPFTSLSHEEAAANACPRVSPKTGCPSLITKLIQPFCRPLPTASRALLSAMCEGTPNDFSCNVKWTLKRENAKRKRRCRANRGPFYRWRTVHGAHVAQCRRGTEPVIPVLHRPPPPFASPRPLSALGLFSGACPGRNVQTLGRPSRMGGSPRTPFSLPLTTRGRSSSTIAFFSRAQPASPCSPPPPLFSSSP